MNKELISSSPNPHFTWFYLHFFIFSQKQPKVKVRMRACPCMLFAGKSDKFYVYMIKFWTPTDETQRDGHNRVWARGGGSQSDMINHVQQGGAKPVRHERSWELHPVCPQFIAKANSTPASKLASFRDNSQTNLLWQIVDLLLFLFRSLMKQWKKKPGYPFWKRYCCYCDSNYVQKQITRLSLRFVLLVNFWFLAVLKCKGSAVCIAIQHAVHVHVADVIVKLCL